MCCLRYPLLVQDLEKKENQFLLNRDFKHSQLQSEISELERKIANDCGHGSKSLTDGLHHSLTESPERFDLMKKVTIGIENLEFSLSSS